MATDIPYAWRSVRIGGGGYVSGLVFHPHEKGLLYARTDVGGAYRWDAKRQQWVSITDWIGADDANLLGIDSLAVDPNDAGRVYLVAGTYTTERTGFAAVLRSNDRGKSFLRSNLPFRMGGNELGRGNGERLAVDPHDGRVLLLGSRDAGLWRSDDRGEHWKKVDAFPAVATSPAATAENTWRRQSIGIVFIAFDQRSGKMGQPTPVIYAGVSTRETSLYRSEDGGASWQPVPGQPTGLRPTHMNPVGDGSYVLTYGDEPGPDTMHDGAIYRYDPLQQRWTDIAPLPRQSKPLGFGWGDVAVDPQHPQTLVATTFADYSPHDRMFRSTDGGKHWMEVFAHSRFEHGNAIWTSDHTPHWMSRVVIDPFDAGRVLFVTGYGIWASRDIRALDNGGTVDWRFEDDGLEETVPLGLVSPATGASLVSAVGDLDGFRHDDLQRAPWQLMAPPRYQNSESIDSAGLAPQVLVRSGRIRGAPDAVRAAISRDGARSWTALADEPPESHGAGSIAVAADGNAVMWLPDGAAHAFLTRDEGRHWTASEGLDGATRVVADRVDPQRFYAIAPGKAFVSRDGGAHFARIDGDLGKRIAMNSDIRATLCPVPGSSGELFFVSSQLGLVHGRDDGRLLPSGGAIESADALGFGRPTSATSSSTLFVAGRSQGKRGIFRSVDGGAHWQRINDDAHQFGQISHIAGDPRVFGRVYIGTGGRGILYGEPVEASP
jgi:photosystem II stability/assembly factor-like uncharacterized protein